MANLPQSFAINSARLAASLTAATLLAWLRLLALDGDLAKAEPKTLRILHAAARLASSGRRRRLRIAATWALGRCHRRRLGGNHRPAAGPMTRANPSRRPRKEHTKGPRGTPPPGAPAGWPVIPGT
ncbi:MAG: family transposase [Actinomycetia bacterium]|nr:family transposase [Actinomycetes bacterium]